MQKAAILVSLLVLGWTRALQGLPVVPEPLYPTQENFNLTKMLGTWYDVAMSSTHPFMQEDVGVGKLVLERGAAEGKLVTIRTTLRNGTCEQLTADYELSSTPGRFFYHIEALGADVDAYVVHTIYHEYAILIMVRQKPSGEEKITTVRLLSRSSTVRDALMEDYKILARQMGITEENIIVKKDKGQCVPGEQVAEQVVDQNPQRLRRDVVPSLPLADVEGSGDDTPLFKGPEACNAEPVVGPCLGYLSRYFYNSSSMSCELFQYGGCMGNQNNFEQERDCLQSCRTEAVCRLPMAPVPCTGQPPIWAFDSSAGLCVAYKPDFCQANANKFYTKAECDEYCGVMGDAPELMEEI